MGQVEDKTIGLSQFDHQTNQRPDLWFHDSVEFAHGTRLSIKIRDVLCHYRSPFQEIAIFETENLGRMLVLDDITMLTEFDEFAYHEMIVHVPMMVHPVPSHILVIGGGDGGTVRELLKHPGISRIHVCEIDMEVIKACRQYLPSIASGFDDPRVEVFSEDGSRFVKEHPGEYDVIIVDSTDPVGPGQVLFQREFYEDMKKALKKGGIAITQCESMYFHQEIIGGVYSFARGIFPNIAYYYTLVPTYPSGIIGFFFCSLKYDPLKDLSEQRAENISGLRYYTPAIHRASFTLPRFGEVLLRREL